jgi:DNA-binding response OmpR family regulator
MLNVMYEILTDEDYQTSTARNGEAALAALEADDFDLVITDLNMGQVNGISVLKQAKELNPSTMVVITTANIDITYAIEALRLKADDYMLKPFNVSELLDRVSYCLGKHSPHGQYYGDHIKLVE